MTDLIADTLNLAFQNNLSQPDIEKSDNGSYLVTLSPASAGIETILQVHGAMEKAGLIDNSRQPIASENGIIIENRNHPLGSIDENGVFCGQLALSDNTDLFIDGTNRVTFGVNFGDRSATEIVEQLLKARNHIPAPPTPNGIGAGGTQETQSPPEAQLRKATR